MLNVSSLTYSYPGETKPALSDVSLHAGPGECLCITGRSGCGKTTLLLAIKGLLPEGVMTGDIQIKTTNFEAELFRNEIGFVFQNADSQILCSTVAEEVAFGPENLCIPPDEINTRINSSLRNVGLAGFGSRNVERLSSGQKHRLAIASVLSMNPKILLLDEPTSQLDAEGKSELVQTLKDLKGQGYTLLIVEHQLEPFKDLVDRYVLMANGRLIETSNAMPAAFAGSQRIDPEYPAERNRLHAGTPMVSINGLCLSYPGVGEILKDIDLAIFKGERVHIFGRNGSGKSSLLAAIAGAVKPDAGTIQVANTKITGKTNMFGRVGYMLQNPQRQLFENTVFEEVAFSLKRLRLPTPEIKRCVNEALEICEADLLIDKLPLTLSFGEQHRVALASVLAPKPDVLLLDEPFSGLDFNQRRRLLMILSNLMEKCATTIVIASHDSLPDQSWPDCVIKIENGAVASS
ncbi:MAG: ABC transporter ATP-binding protein [Deltaproteobacteria bacterium HGW-Deltaproteobacteria-13]|jgi:energy-coupling factor transport system ATP-binding protein|nr:MAG: ABC transporter ATP-binding protein [Deltaproteobacteria bacterium HGW-Deltaproteobacteria-13]